VEIDFIMQKWLPYILGLLIAIQSVVAVADMHQSFESGAEYVSFDDSNDLTFDVERKGPKKSDKFPDDEYGCHHCCHCLGIFFPNANDRSNITLSGKRLFEYSLKFPSSLIFPHLRPPIL